MSLGTNLKRFGCGRTAGSSISKFAFPYHRSTAPFREAQCRVLIFLDLWLARVALDTRYPNKREPFLWQSARETSFFEKFSSIYCSTALKRLNNGTKSEFSSQEFELFPRTSVLEATSPMKSWSRHQQRQVCHASKYLIDLVGYLKSSEPTEPN